MSESPDSSSDFLIPEERCFLLPEEPLPPPVRPVENLPPRVQPVENLPLTNLPPLVQPVANLPLPGWPPLDSDSDSDAETRDSLVVHCSDFDVIEPEPLTWVHHQGDWRCVMTKHVQEIAMNLDLHETMDWLEY